MDKRQLKRLGIGHNEAEIEERNFLLDSPTPIADGNMATHIVLGEIGAFIIGCYGMEINPLPFLRAIYPTYEWKFHELPEEKELEKLICTSDYFWGACRYEWIHWVTARKIGVNAPKKVFGNGFIEDMFAGETECKELLRRCKVQEFWPDYMRGNSNELIG
jgi:hypothetical protein